MRKKANVVIEAAGCRIETSTDVIKLAIVEADGTVHQYEILDLSNFVNGAYLVSTGAKRLPPMKAGA